MNFRRIADTIKSYNFRSLNFRLIIYVIALSIIGINVISSATPDRDYVVKQIIGLVAGVVLMIIFMLIRYDFVARYYWLMYFFTIIILLLVITPLGHSAMGAQRWIVVLGVQLQPSEFAKFLLIIFFSMILYKNQQTMNNWRFIIFLIGLAGIPILLILEEPDLSTSIVTIVTICAIILASDIHKKFVRTVAVIGAILAAIVMALVILLPADHNILNEYQYNRLVGFYDEDNEVAEKIRYQQENSIIAIANGSLSGIGLNNNSIESVKNADFISQPQTDFIFTVVGEEMGFLGGMLIIILLLLVVIECFVIGMRAKEQLGRCIAVGMGSLIGFQTFINIGVVTMLIPNTGLTLPFISAGLSSMLELFMGIGMVLNIGLQKRITF